MYILGEGTKRFFDTAKLNIMKYRHLPRKKDNEIEFGILWEGMENYIRLRNN